MSLSFIKRCADQCNPLSRQPMFQKVFTSTKLAAVSRYVMASSLRNSVCFQTWYPKKWRGIFLGVSSLCVRS